MTRDERDEFTGRSLTMREFLERVLWWMDLGAPLGGRGLDPEDHEARLESLRQEIVSYEMRRMFERLDGEDWPDIRRSAQGGRWE